MALEFGNYETNEKTELAHRITMRVLKRIDIKSHNEDYSYTTAATTKFSELMNSSLFDLRELNLKQVLQTI